MAFHPHHRLMGITITWAVILILLASFPSALCDPTVCSCPKNNGICELEEMKLKIARLESVVEESTQSLNMKARYLEEKEKLLEEMEDKLQFLQNDLIDFKQTQSDLSYSAARISKLEGEVRRLWDVSRKNNFNLHMLEAKVCDTEEKVKVLTAEVEQMNDIVTEQWIQIRQLDQALKVTEMRALSAQRRAVSDRCTFMKFVKDIHGHHLPKMIGMLDSSLFRKDFGLAPCMSQLSHQFRRIMSAAQRYHHKLQRFVKDVMERNEVTAVLVNNELVFFLASALITFPVMSAWILLTSYFR